MPKAAQLSAQPGRLGLVPGNLASAHVINFCAGPRWGQGCHVQKGLVQPSPSGLSSFLQVASKERREGSALLRVLPWQKLQPPRMI